MSPSLKLKKEYRAHYNAFSAEQKAIYDHILKPRGLDPIKQVLTNSQSQFLDQHSDSQR